MSETKRAFLSLLVICILARAGMWSIYEPIFTGDTPSYVTLASQIQRLDFSGYNADRTPGYPLFLLLSGLNFQVAWILQSLLGISVAALLFLVALRRTGNSGLSLLVGVSHGLALHQMFFEATIGNETLATFLVVLSLAVFLWARTATRPLVSFLLLGVVVSLAALTRPLLLSLIPVYLTGVLFRDATSGPASGTAWRLGAYLTPVVLLILGWSLFNGVTTGSFAPTALTGYHLVNHSGAFIELAPDEYADIRDIYLQFRPQQLEAVGSNYGTIWLAGDAIQKKTGLSYGDLSNQLTRMSITLFVQHPLRYLKGVSQSWSSFWIPRLYWSVDKIRLPSVGELLVVLWVIEAAWFIAMNLLFLLIALWSASQALRRKHAPDLPVNLVLIAAVLVGSVVQALMEVGDNPRFATPFQPVILYLVFLSGWQYVSRAQWRGEVRVRA